MQPSAHNSVQESLEKISEVLQVFLSVDAGHEDFI